ncbi:methylmalonyl-CoA epimerase [bacterium]|nr:methylmalonyl-CoA epimerase [Chloroflexi bacterium CFX6]RIL10364.1 MAG: methylmalonyl-CoA epimerase [bacterium]
MKVRRIDHMAIAVDNLDTALPFFTQVLGLRVTHTDVEEGQGVVVAFLPIGDSEIELIEPVQPDSGVARFLQRRGGGMHHLCLEVDDMDAALAHLRAHGVRLIDETPYIGTGGRRIVFIHPKSSHGVLVELYEALPDDRRLTLDSLDDLRRRLVERGREASERVRGAADGARGFIDGLRRRR